jgi:hypothetical protein
MFPIKEQVLSNYNYERFESELTGNTLIEELTMIAMAEPVKNNRKDLILSTEKIENYSRIAIVSLE